MRKAKGNGIAFCRTRRESESGAIPAEVTRNELAEMQVFLLLKIGQWNAGYELDRGFKYIQYIYLCFWGDVI